MLGLNDDSVATEANAALLHNAHVSSTADAKPSLLAALVKFNRQVAQKRNKVQQILLPVLINLWIITGLRTTSPDYIIPETKFYQTVDPVRGCVAGSKSVSFFCDTSQLSAASCDDSFESFMSLTDTFYWDVTRFNSRDKYHASLILDGNAIGVQLNSRDDVDIDVLSDSFPSISAIEEPSGRTCHAFNDPNCAPITFVHSCASLLEIAALHSLNGSPGSTLDYRFRIFPQPATPVNGITDSVLIWLIPLYLSGLFLNMFNYALIELVSEKEGKHRDYLVSWGFTKLIHFKAWMISNSFLGLAAIVMMTFMLVHSGVFAQSFWLHIFLGCISYFISLLSIAYILSVRVSNTRTASSVASFTDLVFNLSSLSVAAIHNRVFATIVSIIPTVPFFLLLRGIAYDEYSPTTNPLLSANQALVMSIITCLSFVQGGLWFVGKDTMNAVNRTSSSPTTLSSLVQISKMVKRYPMSDNDALKGIDFTIVPDGEIVTVIGGNGAGKTTLIHSILGIVSPTNCEEFLVPQNHEICVCLQDDCFWESLTVMDHIDFFGKTLSNCEQNKINQYIADFQLQDCLDKMCGTLSGGQKRRLSSMLAFMKSERTDARLLVLDEPTTGIDVAGRRIIWDQIRAAAKTRKKSVLLTTHYLDEARELSDTIVVMMEGKVKAKGSLIELQQLQGGFVLKFDGDIFETIEEFRKICPKLLHRGENEIYIPSAQSSRLKPLLAHAEELEKLGVVSNICLDSISLDNLFDDDVLETSDSSPRTQNIATLEGIPVIKIPSLKNQVMAMTRIRLVPVLSNFSTFFSTVVFPLVMVSFSVFARFFSTSSTPEVTDQFHFHIANIMDGFNVTTATTDSKLMIPLVGESVPGFLGDWSSIISVPPHTDMMDFLSSSYGQWYPFAVDTVKNEIWLNPANPRSGFAVIQQILNPAVHLSVSSYLSTDQFQQTVVTNVFNMAIYVVLSLTIVSSQCATFIFDERNSFIKRLAQIEGLRPLGYWLGSCVGHLGVYLPLSLFVPYLATLVLDRVLTDVPGYWALLGLAGLVNGIQLILFGYFFVFWYKSKESMLKYNSLAGLVFAEALIAFGLILVLSGKDHDGVYAFVLSMVSPYFTVSGTIAHMAKARLAACPPSLNGGCDWIDSDFSLHVQFACIAGGIVQIAILVAILVMKEKGDVLRLLRPSFDTPWGVVREMVEPSVVRERERILNPTSHSSNNDDVLFVKLWHAYPHTPPGWMSIFPMVMDEKKNPLVPEITWAVRDLTLGVPKNQVLGILGENGAGKSTAISILLGVTKPVAGYAGVTPGCRIGFCPQINALWDKLTGLEHVRFYATIRGAWVNELHAIEILNMVGLPRDSHKKLTREYSGGMKRRLCLAIALIGDPDVLILDEPTAGVDIAGKREMWKIIKRLCRDGCSVLITTHSLEEADNLCSRISIMSHGQLIKVGTTNELKKEQQKIFVTIVEPSEKRPLTPTGATTSMDALFRGSLGTLAVKAKETKMIENTHEYEIDLKYTKLSEVVALLVELNETKIIQDFFIHQLSLEDVFLNTIGKQRTNE